MPLPTALGHLIEGVVEYNTMTDRYQIVTLEAEGSAKTVDVQDLLGQYEGKEVRFTLASFDNLSELAKLVESAGGGLVSGITPEQLPTVPFNIVRKS